MKMARAGSQASAKGPMDSFKPFHAPARETTIVVAGAEDL